MDSLVARIVAAGLTSAVFTYFLIQLVVKPALARRGNDWWHALATNGLALLIAVAVSFALTFLMADSMTARVAVEAVLVGVIAASVATFGHEAVKNFGARNVTNVSGDSITVGDIEESAGVAIGADSGAEVDA